MVANSGGVGQQSNKDQKVSDSRKEKNVGKPIATPAAVKKNKFSSNKDNETDSSRVGQKSDKFQKVSDQVEEISKCLKEKVVGKPSATSSVMKKSKAVEKGSNKKVAVESHASEPQRRCSKVSERIGKVDSGVLRRRRSTRLGIEERRKEEAAMVREVINEMLNKVEKAVKVVDMAKKLKLTRDVSHMTRANSVGPAEESSMRSPAKKTQRSLSIQEELFVRSCSGVTVVQHQMEHNIIESGELKVNTNPDLDNSTTISKDLKDLKVEEQPLKPPGERLRLKAPGEQSTQHPKEKSESANTKKDLKDFKGEEELLKPPG